MEKMRRLAKKLICLDFAVSIAWAVGVCVVGAGGVCVAIFSGDTSTAGEDGLSFSIECENSLEAQTSFTVGMLDRGFLVNGSFYPCLAHDERHVDACAVAADEVFEDLAEAIRQGDVATRLSSPAKQTKFQRLA